MKPQHHAIFAALQAAKPEHTQTKRNSHLPNYFQRTMRKTRGNLQSATWPCFAVLTHIANQAEGRPMEIAALMLGFEKCCSST